MLLSILLAAACVSLRFAPSPPVPLGSSLEDFSGERAEVELRRLLDGIDAHPCGSPDNALVRQRIVGRLSELGYAPSLQERFACGRFGDCMPVTNIVARIDGGRDVLLLAAHYDSVGAGPGASDDGVGVAAVLEAARALRESKPANTIVFLLTDGEEMGLLGATQFMQTPLAQRVMAVVNVDNRGTRGPSLMFETAGPTSSLSPLLNHLPRPLASSLFGGIYELLPNDTDFTRFRERGAVGFNFAMIGDVASYHTDRDDLEHVSRAGLQHHGENVLALARALASRDLATLKDGERAVYFDWLGLHVFQWPERFALHMALAAMSLLLGAIALALRRAPSRLRELLGAAGWAWVCLMAPIVFGGLIVIALGFFRQAPMPWHAALYVPTAAVVVLFAVVALSVGPRVSRGDFWMRYCGVHLPLAALASGVSVIFAPASHLFVVPLFVSSVVALFGTLFRVGGWERAGLVMLSTFVTTTLWFRVALGIAAAVNVSALPIIGVAAAVIATPLTLLLRRRLSHSFMLASGTCVLLTVATFAYPAYDQDSPQRASVVHFVKDDEEPQWWVDVTWGPPSEALLQVAPLVGQVAPPFPIFGMWQIARAKGPDDDADRPQLRVTDVQPRGPGQRRWSVNVRSRRGADTVGLLLPNGMRVHYPGRVLSTVAVREPSRFAGHRLIRLRGVGTEGVDLKLTAAGGRDSEVLIFDVVRGHEGAATALAAARDGRAVPSQEGDLSILMRTVRLGP